MKRIFSSRNILFIILVLNAFSCSSDLDFEQTDEFNSQPVITANLAYGQAKASDFIENGIELTSLSYTSKVGFFDASFVNDNLVKAELYFRIKNTINKAFTLKIDLEEDNGVPVRNIEIEVPASIDDSEVLVVRPVIFEESETDEIRRTTHMVFTVTMLPGTPPLAEDSPGRIELSSSITAYFDVRK